MNYFSIPREWENRTALIVGGGPSAALVRGHEEEIYKRFQTIVVNDSVFLLPHAEVLYFRDLSWWQDSITLPRSDWVRKHFKGDYILTSENEIWGVARLRETGDVGLDPNPQCLRHGSNSGYQAIHIAYHFGAKRIVLLGFDMRVVNGNAHWNHNHCGKQNAAGFAQTLRDVMLPKFETLKTPLAQAGVEVLNATPDSALRVWPFLCFEDLLKD